jgi:hypothetical protein
MNAGSGFTRASDNNNNDGNNVVRPSVEELGWCITWTRAFPTLLSSFAFGSTTSSNHDIVWQRLALDVLWGSKTHTSSSSMTGTMGRSEASMTPTFSPTAHFSWTHSLGYGEICPDTVLSILQRIPHLASTNDSSDSDNNNNNKGITIADLGSGNGKVLLTAALGLLSVDRAIGIEIAPSLHAQAVSNYQEHYKYWDADCSSCNTGSSTGTTSRPTIWEWKCGDFTVDTEWVGLVDLVFIHATVFEEGLMEQLNVLCEGCKKGTYFCMVSQPLATSADAPGTSSIETIDEVHLDMNWGQATVYLQRKN